MFFNSSLVILITSSIVFAPVYTCFNSFENSIDFSAYRFICNSFKISITFSPSGSNL
ncbi:hypothetical protein [Fusobacterium sp.]|uniref:hypothetical protein n=1 Tax=Fusobacterium sp. TaxID=68766 RepID=UPI0039C36C66